MMPQNISPRANTDYGIKSFFNNIYSWLILIEDRDITIRKSSQKADTFYVFL